MSGRTEVLFIAVAIIGAIASFTDMRQGRIYNWLTMPAMLAGLLMQFHFDGLSGVGAGALGIGAAFALYGWMFAVGAMGAGDVKLLMAFGAWGGVRYVMEVALLGVIFGGALGLALLAVRGKLPDFLARMKRFLLTLAVKELEAEAPKIDRTQTMPYGPPIALAAISVARGVRLW